MRVRKIQLTNTNLEILNNLEKICFPKMPPYNKQSAVWWFVYDNNNTPIAFAGAKLWEPDNYVYLCLSGVLPNCRGKGIQKKLINVRIKWAKSIGAKGCYTYTVPENYPSSNSLISCGFKLFKPAYKWGYEDGLYWIKKFT